ncbi:hypothetical protein Tco_1100185 [Tanacetum coccineum]
MTRSSTNELFTPFKDTEREFRSSRKHFKTLSLDELRSPDFNLFSNQEYSEEEVAETMAETIEQYMSKSRADYGSGVARTKIEDKDNFELKGQFLKELRTNTFSAVSRWLRNETTGSITTWDGLKTIFLNKYCPPAQTTKKMEEINKFHQEPDENWKRISHQKDEKPSKKQQNRTRDGKVCENEAKSKSSQLREEKAKKNIT